MFRGGLVAGRERRVFLVRPETPDNTAIRFHHYHNNDLLNSFVSTRGSNVLP
jgi:hypothetical protein